MSHRCHPSPIGGGNAEEMIRSAARGDKDAVCAVWEHHRRWVAAILLAHKPRFEEVDDLLQEVAILFVRHVDTIREPATFRGWLRTVAINTARAAARNGKHRPDALSPNGHIAVDDEAGRRLMRDEQMQELLDRLAELPELYREPLLLRTMSGMRSREVAELLGITPATVDTRVARARRMLRSNADAPNGRIEDDSAEAAQGPLHTSVSFRYRDSL